MSKKILMAMIVGLFILSIVHTAKAEDSGEEVHQSTDPDNYITDQKYSEDGITGDIISNDINYTEKVSDEDHETFSDDSNEPEDYPSEDKSWDISNDFNDDVSHANVTYNTSAQYYTVSQVELHNSQDDCWISVYDRVYDVTGLDSHIICGADQTALYSGDRGLTVSNLNQYFIGYLDTSYLDTTVSDKSNSAGSSDNSTNESVKHQSGSNAANLGATDALNAPSTAGNVNDVRFTSSDFKAPAKSTLWHSIWTWFGFK